MRRNLALPCHCMYADLSNIAPIPFGSSQTELSLQSQFGQINYLRHKFLLEILGKLKNSASYMNVLLCAQWSQRMVWVITRLDHWLVVKTVLRQNQTKCAETIETDTDHCNWQNQQKPSVQAVCQFADWWQVASGPSWQIVGLQPNFIAMISYSYFVWMTIVVAFLTIITLLPTCIFVAALSKTSQSKATRLPFGPTFQMIYAKQQWNHCHYWFQQLHLNCLHLWSVGGQIYSNSACSGSTFTHQITH